MLKCALCFSLLKSCGPPNDIISFFGPLLKKFADPWSMVFWSKPIVSNIVSEGRILEVQQNLRVRIQCSSQKLHDDDDVRLGTPSWPPVCWAVFKMASKIVFIYQIKITTKGLQKMSIEYWLNLVCRLFQLHI